MSRHRSPSGRNAYHGPPLPASGTVAGAGGTHRSPVLSVGLLLPGSLRGRVVAGVATVVAGSAVAATGQAAFSGALPSIGGDTNVLRLGFDALTGAPAPAAPAAPSTVSGADMAQLAAPPPVAAVVPERAPVNATGLVKAVDLHQQAADAAATAATAVKAVEAAKAAKAAQAAVSAQPGVPAALSTAGGAVQMVVGRISSGFGMRGGVLHAGVDIAAPIGTPIHVPLAGTVISSGPASGFGLWVRVQHADGTITVYGHINRSLVNVGDKVSAGQEIAEVGNRGESTGPHLHFEVVTPGGQKINPQPWLAARGIGI